MLSNSIKLGQFILLFLKYSSLLRKKEKAKPLPSPQEKFKSSDKGPLTKKKEKKHSPLESGIAGSSKEYSGGLSVPLSPGLLCQCARMLVLHKQKKYY